ncbi:hypothetical protein E2C01_037722 [Portunus trituberculatus]|uniref:Uncharacterized protein n=1 Tax=Portunus trituberculatus TaxID=210409 RepID=A0A5B7FA38_PORTR|nr:hypothetical protein [Portunus trituberculatus]
MTPSVLRPDDPLASLLPPPPIHLTQGTIIHTLSSSSSSHSLPSRFIPLAIPLLPLLITPQCPFLHTSLRILHPLGTPPFSSRSLTFRLHTHFPSVSHPRIVLFFIAHPYAISFPSASALTPLPSTLAPSSAANYFIIVRFSSPRPRTAHLPLLHAPPSRLQETIFALLRPARGLAVQRLHVSQPTPNRQRTKRHIN